MNFARLILAVLVVTACARAQTTPEWIWHPNGGAKPEAKEVRYFRKSFTVEGATRRATLAVSADNKFTEIGRAHV